MKPGKPGRYRGSRWAEFVDDCRNTFIIFGYAITIIMILGVLGGLAFWGWLLWRSLVG